jgi:Do/DeqQ family serine protease
MMPRLNPPAALAVALLLLPALLSAAAAQERRVPTSLNEVRLSYAPVVQRAAPTVVNVYAAKTVAVQNPLLDDPIFRRFFGAPGGEQQPQVQRSLGSGVLVDPSGLVVTNNHVIEGADEMKVSLSDKREFEATLVLKDTRSDLAVLRLKTQGAERFPVIEFSDSDALQVGDVVLAIGNPFAVGQTVTHGIVSAVARTQVGITDYQFFIQTDAAINPGNSGGALVDLSGRLVGINTAIFSRSGGSQGIGFAIPANMVKVVVASAKGGGSAVKRPWLGARLQAVTPEIAESLGQKRPTGALVASLVAGSPGARAGLKTGDLITTIDGQEVEDPNAFDYRFATKSLGGSAKVGLVRAGKETAVTVALESLPDTPHDELTIASRSPFQGAKVSNLSPALADQMRLDPSTDGVIITAVTEGSPAQNLGFHPGDLVVTVNNQKIAKTRDLEKATSQPNRVWRITIVRGGQQMSVVLSG